MRFSTNNLTGAGPLFNLRGLLSHQADQNGPMMSAQLQQIIPAHIAALQDMRTRSRASRIQAFLDYMISIQPWDRLPARSDFEPMAIPRLLDGIVLVQVEHHGDWTRFKTKVVGQSIVAAAPARITNRYLDEFAKDIGGADEILTTRQTVVDTSLPWLNQSEPLLPFAYKMRSVEYVHCPLASDGRTVDQIVSCFCYLSAE